ncbi:MAG: TonB-dependent hemoglobin/transferrin/lactoferrin family receptor [Opitutales bacterium]
MLRDLLQLILCLAAASTVLGSGEGARTLQMSETTLTGAAASASELETLELEGRVDTFTARDIVIQGIQDLGDLTRYSINADVPFDAGSGDGLVPQLSSGNSSINIRGLEGNRILLTLDGIRQPQTFIAGSFNQAADSPGGTGRDFFDPALFEGVTLVKGAALNRFGSGALGGAVNLESPDPSDILGAARYRIQQRLRYFSRNESINTVSTGAARAGDFDALASYSYRVGSETENNGTTPANPVAFTSHALLAKVSYLPVPEHQFLAGFEYFFRDVETDVDSAERDPVVPNLSNELALNDETRERYRWSLEYEWMPTAAFVDGLDTQVFYQTTESSLLNLQQGSLGSGETAVRIRDREQKNVHDVSLLGANLFADRLILGEAVDHALTAGLNTSWSRAENTFERIDQLPFPDESNQMGFAPSDTFRFGGFVEDALRFGEARRWTVAPAVRVDYYAVEPDRTASYEDRLAQVNDELNFQVEPAVSYQNITASPSVILSYAVTDQLLLWSSYASTIRNPTQEELSLLFLHPSAGGGNATFAVIPNPDLRPERSHSFEAGVGGEYPWARFSVNGFYSLYFDFIEANFPIREPDDRGTVDPSDDIVGLQQSQNVGDVIIYGFESDVEVPLGHFMSALDGFHLGAATGGSYGQNVTTDQPLNSIDPWKTVSWLSYDEPADGRYGARLTATYVEGKDADRIDQTRPGGPFIPSDAHLVFDFSAYWQPTEHLSFAAGINNLFDEQYFEWSTLRRAVGHSTRVTDRLTEPGRNFFISASLTF